MKGKNHARSMAKELQPAWKFQDVPVEERKSIDNFLNFGILNSFIFSAYFRRFGTSTG